jgi:hypothetical protein
MCGERDRPEPTDDNELVREVARMLSEWEVSDELASEFALRLIAKCREERR